MSENREGILADFQACTGIEDVALAIFHLEETNWDLMAAVSNAMPPDSQAFQSDRSDPDVMIVDDSTVSAMPVGSASNYMKVSNHVKHSDVEMQGYLTDNLNQPSTSRGGSRKKAIKFNIRHNDKVTPIELSDTATMSDLKMAIQTELKVPSCRQILVGWTNRNVEEDIPFSKLNVNEVNSFDLHIRTTEGAFDAEQENEVTERLNGTFTLNIKYDSKWYNLKFRGTTPILEVKIGINALTNIEVRNQVWSGWPPNIDDDTLLALSGINFPEHDLVLSRSTASSSNNKETEKKSSISVMKIDSDEEEYEDASESFNVDDDYFVEDVTIRKMEPLIPENVDDEIVGSLTFIERFTARYGPIHPAFFQGSLEEAIQEACNKPAKDRKILAIYLHHDSSVLTNVFCTQLLGFESVMQMFEKNFILWGWDLTFESNSTRLQQSVTSNLGPVASMSLRNMPIDRLPAIVLIMRSRSSTDIFNVIHGNVGVNELLSSLIEAVEVFKDHQKVEIKEEQERAERELVKMEQDQAFRESLEADRAKEEARRSKEKAENEAKRKLESEQAEEMRRKEAYRIEVEKALPSEPPLGQGDKESITQIRFRLPKGQYLERRFHITAPLKVLLDFLIVKGYPSQEYKVISSWPRRDLTTLNQNETLQELKLHPQETLILEER
ncbi:hypothetical protein HHI36_002913 [Cryptolaemus montrouzieri]|uniref:FAS-associated factor 1 n=1 Tax=Cryptolaemus montrouzieri TaxID=559131 RepID=A0ABD2PBX0_9CUCU